MGKFSYVPLTDDLIPGATITIITPNADYPATELQTIPMGTTARITDPGGGEVIRVDFGGNVNPKFWSMLNTDIISGNPLITSYTDAWATPEDTLSMVYRDRDMKAYKDTGWTPRRYFDINLNACAFSHAFAEIGKLFVALDITTFSKDVGLVISRGEEHRNIHNRTPAGIEYVHKLQAKIGHLGVTFRNTKSSILSEILTFLRTTYGGGYPSIIIPDNTEVDFYYMRNNDRTDWNEQLAQEWILSECSMNFTEVSRGKIQEG